MSYGRKQSTPGAGDAGEPVVNEVDGRLVINGKLIHLANAGVIEAQLMLAKIHRVKNPQLRNLDKALRWLRAAAENGSVEAQLELGLIFQLGEEVPQDSEQAAQLYCDAALQGSAEAAYRLAMMFYLGKSVSRDLVSAHAWFSIAYANGRRDVRLPLKNIRKQLSAEEREEADKLFERIQTLA